MVLKYDVSIQILLVKPLALSHNYASLHSTEPGKQHSEPASQFPLPAGGPEARSILVLSLLIDKGKTIKSALPPIKGVTSNKTETGWSRTL